MPPFAKPLWVLPPPPKPCTGARTFGFSCIEETAQAIPDRTRSGVDNIHSALKDDCEHTALIETNNVERDGVNRPLSCGRSSSALEMPTLLSGYELYLAIEDIDHSRTKTKSPQTNGICERFHKTVLNEFYRVAFRKKVYRFIDELQADLDVWIHEYNEARPHQGRWCFGKTPMQTFLDAMPMTKEKMIAA